MLGIDFVIAEGAITSTPGSFGIPLDGDFLMRDPRAETRYYLRLCRQILVDCDPNILQRLFARCPLAIATGQIITPNGEPLLGFNQRHVIFHNSKVQHSENFFKLFVRRKVERKRKPS